MSAPRTVFSARRSATRLAAVQALYAVEVSGGNWEVVLDDLIARAWEPERKPGDPQEPAIDPGFLRALVSGVIAQRDLIDAAIEESLAHGWTLSRLEILLRAILRVGACELLAMPDVPSKVVINEHLEITHAFFAGKEPSLVNAVLDRLAVRFRGGAAAAPGDDGRGRG